MQDLIPRVTIMAIGADQYVDDAFENLPGPEKDIDNLKNLLVENEKTALFNNDQFIEVFNEKTEEIRNTINEYIMNRSAGGDILILYFSGHGVPIGRTDFGFCTTDTTIHPFKNVPLPINVIKYSDLLRSLLIANVTPIIIIDACYSGLAGTSHYTSPIDAISSMQSQIHSSFGSNYALICACSEIEIAQDSKEGGVFSQALFQAAYEGIDSNNPTLTLQQLYSNLNKSILKVPLQENPRLFVGETLPSFPLILNTQYRLKSYTLSQHLVDVLIELWNNGDERELLPNEIGKLLSTGSYGNHKKLSYKAWDLVETVPDTNKKRRLTNRGKDFINGNIQVPNKVIEDPISGEYKKADDSKDVGINDFT